MSALSSISILTPKEKRDCAFEFRIFIAETLGGFLVASIISFIDTQYVLSDANPCDRDQTL
jgi:hypothetical protein